MSVLDVLRRSAPVLGGAARIAGATLQGHAEDQRDRLRQLVTQREGDESRARIDLNDAQRREVESRIGRTGVTYKTDGDGNVIGLPTQVMPGGLLSAPSDGPSSGARLPIPGLPADAQPQGIEPQAPAIHGITAMPTGVKAPVKPPAAPKPPSVASSPTRIAALPDGRRMVTQRDPKTGHWDAATSAAGDTVFAPTPRAPAPHTDPVLAAVKSAQSRVDQQQRDMRAVLARRPRASQYADPLTRMADTTALDEAMNNWRADSTAQASSLQAAREALGRIQGPGPANVGRGSAPPTASPKSPGMTSALRLSPSDSAHAARDPAFAAWLHSKGYKWP